MRRRRPLRALGRDHAGHHGYRRDEAVLRFKRQSPGGWFATLGFPESVHPLGTGNTGVVDASFDVTPFSNSVDGVVGYADSSTTITGYGDLALTIRMNPAGFFDVRNGGAFAAKLYCSEMASRITDRGVQVHGGLGYLSTTPVERLFRDARLYRIYEGTSEVQKVVIARSLLREAGMR